MPKYAPKKPQVGSYGSVAAGQLIDLEKTVGDRLVKQSNIWMTEAETKAWLKEQEHAQAHRAAERLVNAMHTTADRLANFQKQFDQAKVAAEEALKALPKKEAEAIVKAADDLRAREVERRAKAVKDAAAKARREAAQAKKAAKAAEAKAAKAEEAAAAAG